MHRLGLRALLLSQRLVSLLVALSLVTACPKEQVDTSASAGQTSGAGVTTGQPTGVDVPTTGAASTGSSGVPTEASSTSTSGTSTGEVTSGETGASSSSSTGDAGLSGTGEGTTGAPPVWTDCFDCLCDINISFCRKVFAGVQGAEQRPVEGPPVECSIVEAEGVESGCVLYPRRCGETPDCDCLPTMDGGCFCNLISPGNFQVTCPLP
jgi:hypothetical protein